MLGKEWSECIRLISSRPTTWWYKWWNVSCAKKERNKLTTSESLTSICYSSCCHPYFSYSCFLMSCLWNCCLVDLIVSCSKHLIVTVSHLAENSNAVFFILHSNKLTLRTLFHCFWIASLAMSFQLLISFMFHFF